MTHLLRPPLHFHSSSHLFRSTIKNSYSIPSDHSLGRDGNDEDGAGALCVWERVELTAEGEKWAVVVRRLVNVGIVCVGGVEEGVVVDGLTIGCGSSRSAWYY